MSIFLLLFVTEVNKTFHQFLIVGSCRYISFLCPYRYTCKLLHVFAISLQVLLFIFWTYFAIHRIQMWDQEPPSCSQKWCQINWLDQESKLYCLNFCHRFLWMRWGTALKQVCICLKVSIGLYIFVSFFMLSMKTAHLSRIPGGYAI